VRTQLGGCLKGGWLLYKYSAEVWVLDRAKGNCCHGALLWFQVRPRSKTKIMAARFSEN